MLLFEFGPIGVVISNMHSYQLTCMPNITVRPSSAGHFPGRSNVEVDRSVVTMLELSSLDYDLFGVGYCEVIRATQSRLRISTTSYG